MLTVQSVRDHIARGDGVDMRDSYGLTMAMTASRGGLPECLRLLIAAGADLDKADPMGRTASIYAAALGRDDCLRLLIDHGADLGAVDRVGMTARAHAVANRNPSSAALIGAQELMQAERAALAFLTSAHGLQRAPRGRSL